MKERDYAYEALAQVTSSDMAVNRGELNGALGKIREMEPDMTSYGLADEIHRRARIYPEAIGDVVLSPSALAKHWRRCAEPKKPERATNQNAGTKECDLCGGNRFVVVCTRRPSETEWMRAHSIKVSEDALIEETAPCPDCNPIEVSHWRHDGTRFVTPDPGRVREMMQS